MDVWPMAVSCRNLLRELHSKRQMAADEAVPFHVQPQVRAGLCSQVGCFWRNMSFISVGRIFKKKFGIVIVDLLSLPWLLLMQDRQTGWSGGTSAWGRRHQGGEWHQNVEARAVQGRQTRGLWSGPIHGKSVCHSNSWLENQHVIPILDVLDAGLWTNRDKRL